MYERHFGFSSPMFADGLAQDDAVFLPECYPQLLGDLQIALARRDAVAVLHGPPGTGKSTLTSHALREISPGLAFCCISHAPLTAHELLEQLLLDFGFEPYKLSRVERLQTWRQFLIEMAATNTRVCVLVESAETLATSVLQALHSLTLADAIHCPGANLVLSTRLDPDTLLATAELEPLDQRVRLRRAMAPLTALETRSYLSRKAGLAGVDSTVLFAADTAQAIHELSNGIVRVIDGLLESGLRFAALHGDRQLTPATVSAVATGQFGLSRHDEQPKGGSSTAKRVTDSRGETVAAVPPSEPVADAGELRESEKDHADSGGSAPFGPTAENDAAEPSGEIPTLDDPVPTSVDLTDTHLRRIELDAIAAAEKLEDLSRSMAETIFGDSEFDEMIASMSEQRLA